MKKMNKSLFILIAIAVVIFSIIAYVIVKSTSTVKAIVPVGEIAAGTRIDESMLKSIDIPVNTPRGYITDKSSLVGQKIRISVSENQLLYINNIMSAWDDFSGGTSIPEDYIVTSIEVPQNRAVGGLITSGDTIDVIGIPNSTYSSADKETLASALGEISEDSYGAEGINLYWVLSNVRVLDTNSTLSQSNESTMSQIMNEGNTSSSAGNYYIIALSYSDYKKLRLAESYLNLWLNISPSQNADNDPMLEKMKENIITNLLDAQAQSDMVNKESEDNDAIREDNNLNFNERESKDENEMNNTNKDNEVNNESQNDDFDSEV